VLTREEPCREEPRSVEPKKESRATGRQSWHQRLSFKRNKKKVERKRKKKKKNEMVIPKLPVLEDSKLPAVVEVEKITLAENKATTRGDDKVSPLVQVVAFHSFKYRDRFANSLNS
jgi:hypothetical protein